MPGSGRLHGNTPRGRAQARARRENEGRFGWLFPKLPPLAPYPPERLGAAAESLREVEQPGAVPGGWSSQNPQPPEGDNPAIPAGFTYFGQFVDHDITFDATSRLGTYADPDATTNFRTARFDLDSLYGSGPTDEPFQYEQPADGVDLATAAPAGRLLLTTTPSGEFDLPRNTQGVALIGDPRNDENGIVSQLQVVFIRFHNRVFDELVAAGAIPSDAVFDEARRIVRWHYQWVVVHDFLRRICGGDVVDGLFAPDPTSGLPSFDLDFYVLKPKQEPFLPVEFSVAAYRFGHSQVRAGYRLSETIERPTFVPGDADPTADLRGKPLLPQWGVEWPRFLEMGGGELQPSRLIDGKISEPLFDLPRLPPQEQQSLPVRNLQRGQDFGLPSGQDVARQLGVKPLSGAEIGTDLDPTPLWLYVLLEARRATGGQRLGPVGARIVAETILGLLAYDPSSFAVREPGWTPTIPGTAGADGTFGLADLVRHATGG